MKTPKAGFLVYLAVLLAFSMSCRVSVGQPPATETPDLATSPASIATAQPTLAPPTLPTAAPQEPAVLASPTPAQQTAARLELPACDEQVCILDGSFVLKRPIGPDGRNTIDATSRYGTLRRRIRDVYHGVQFLNSTGTPVLAAAAGDVEVSGDDSQLSYGPRLDMFGDLVILTHTLPEIPEPIYTLYAHLSDRSVKAEGDVAQSEQVGSVGMSGSVRGSTLYFEVRYGENAYAAAVNPELWLEPILDDSGDPMGALAGKVVNELGEYVSIQNITIENLNTAAGGKLRTIYLRTYLEEDQLGLSPWEESFAAGDLPEGTYQITFWHGANQYQRQVEIEPGKLTYVNFVVR